MKYLTVAPESSSKPITIQVLDAAPDVSGTAKPGTHRASGLGVAAAARAATDKGIPSASTVNIRFTWRVDLG
ncbi:hypothetical protein SAMN05216386_2193 [Nitrosospira briensis]|uniref:Uncharacterized protein n=1 Tax=Nitrosospira briensis TaxID=35799 RepID=A0A1I5D3V2_9PROT|nr:hypothetical protein SAMN05216386_2193 [Nitrosospira briensis]